MPPDSSPGFSSSHSLLHHTHPSLVPGLLNGENPGAAGGLDALYSHKAEMRSSERASNLLTQHSRYVTKPGQ